MARQANKIREHQRRVVKDIQSFITIMGVEAVKHYRKSFRNQGFTDQTLSNWKPRKRTERSRSGSRAILIKTGDLRRSVRVIRKTLKGVTVGSDLPYAIVHNDGLRAGRGAGFIMPKRQFIGASMQLNRRLKRILNRKIKTTFR